MQKEDYGNRLIGVDLHNPNFGGRRGAMPGAYGTRRGGALLAMDA